jgi:hypothetical protein
MLKHFTYTKDNKEVSERTVYPLSVLDFGSVDVKLQAIDLSELEPEERSLVSATIDDIHRKYLNDLYDAGLGKYFRSFFLRGIS